MMDLVIINSKKEARVDSRKLSEYLQNQHKAITQLIDNYLRDFKELGVVPFQMEKPNKQSRGGRPERYALLNEDQAFLLLSFSRNTAHIRKLKVELVKAFSRFRQHKQIETDYLPFYHELHDEVKTLSDQAHKAGSTTQEQIFHIHFNKLINKAFGLKSGQRPGLPDHLRAKVTAANVIASELLKDAINYGMSHKQAYAHVKSGVKAFANVGTKLQEVA